ncbi:MAG: hypothetical protein ACE5D7_00875 [Fidelibacterota bacterium]
MNKSLILAFLLLGVLSAQPWTHGFKDALIDGGYMDSFSIYHAGIGGVKTVINEGFWWMNEKYNWMDEPSPTKQVLGNLALAVLWELGEWYVESPEKTWESYDKFYNGHALENNLMDILLDVAVFSIPHYKGMYYDYKIWRLTIAPEIHKNNSTYSFNCQLWIEL